MMGRAPLIDYLSDRAAAALERFEEFQDLLLRARGEREFSVGEVVRPNGERYVASFSEKLSYQDPTIEADWLKTCPKYRRHCKSFIPDRRARLWPLNDETGKVDFDNEISPGKLFFRSFERADFILRDFELLYVASGVIQQREVDKEDGELGPLYDKRLLGVATFQPMNIINFSRTREESAHLKDQSAFDTTAVYQLQRALGIGVWDWRDDPRGMDPPRE
jgi:hypothetical protein